MPTQRNYWYNLAIITVITLVFCVIQTTLWYQLFGGTPAPHFWMNICLFIILHRKPVEAILINYFLSFFIIQFTVLPLGYFMIALLIISTFFNYIKKQIFWPETKYFVIASIGMVILFEILMVLISRFFEANPSPIAFVDRFFEVILTPIFSAPIYWLLTWLDKITEYDSLPESGGPSL